MSIAGLDQPPNNKQQAQQAARDQYGTAKTESSEPNQTEPGTNHGKNHTELELKSQDEGSRVSSPDRIRFESHLKVGVPILGMLPVGAIVSPAIQENLPTRPKILIPCQRIPLPGKIRIQFPRDFLL
jgi:hypothetical protein